MAQVEREVLKVALQLPAIAGPQFDVLPEDAFLLPVHQRVRAAIEAAGGCATADRRRRTGSARSRRRRPTTRRASLISGLAVEPLRSELISQERYADAIIARLQWIVGAREIVKLKARVQRLNPVEAARGLQPGVRRADHARGPRSAARRARDRWRT